MMKKRYLLLPLLLLGAASSLTATPLRDGFGLPGSTTRADTMDGVDRFSGCRELGGYLRDVIDRGYISGARYFTAVDGTPLFGTASDAYTTASADSTSAPTEYSKTNVQESGVDEPDLIKTDGEYMYIANGAYFTIVRGYPPLQMELLFEHELEGQAQGLFITDTLAVVFSTTGFWQGMSLDIMPNTSAMTKLEVFDITTPATPRLLRELYLEGGFETARMVNGRIHLVISSILQSDWVYATPAPPVLNSKTETLSALGALAAPPSVSVEGLVPKVVDRIHSDNETRSDQTLLTECDQVIVPPREEGVNMMTILTMNLDDPLATLESTTLLTDYGTVYASAERLYIATMTSNFWAFADGGQETTRIHRFSLGDTVNLEAAGDVQGTILNRYSLSDQAGYLRVATTSNNWGWAGNDPENNLFVLEMADSALEVIGTLPGLGHAGERIYAVRFDGDRGYVVTFRTTDPLYTLDLSDPFAPLAVGELEVPGFSTYLHPVGQNHLLGIGQDPDQWSTDVSLYDISDFAAPRLVERVTLGPDSWSEALYEPKAFTYYEPAGLLTIPVNKPVTSSNILGEPQQEQITGAVVLKVDLATGIDYQGLLQHHYPNAALGTIRRSLFVGSGGEYVIYTLSDLALEANSATDLSYDLAVQPLPGKSAFPSGVTPLPVTDPIPADPDGTTPPLTTDPNRADATGTVEAGSAIR